MNIENMFDSILQVQRMVKGGLDSHGGPIMAPTIVGTYPCRVGKTTGLFTQGAPQGITDTKPRIYTIAEADIKAGDIAIVNGTDKYIIDYPYKPGMNHTECDCHRKAEP